MAHRIGHMDPPALTETTTRDYYRTTDLEELLLIRQNARAMLDAGVDPELVARLYPEHPEHVEPGVHNNLRARPKSRA